MRITFPYALIVGLIALTGCTLPGGQSGMLARQDGPVPGADVLVSTTWLADHLADPDVVVLHVGRSRTDYAAAHVPGARFLPLSAIVVEQGELPNELPSVARLDSVFERLGVSGSSRVILYGDQGGLSAARAFFTLDYLGHPGAALLDGGLEVWRTEGRSLSQGEPVVTPSSFTPLPRPEIVVGAEWVRRHLGDSAVVLLDARPPAQFAGTDPGDGVLRPGHIPGARNVFW